MSPCYVQNCHAVRKYFFLITEYFFYLSHCVAILHFSITLHAVATLLHVCSIFRKKAPKQYVISSQIASCSCWVGRFGDVDKMWITFQLMWITFVDNLWISALPMWITFPLMWITFPLVWITFPILPCRPTFASPADRHPLRVSPTDTNACFFARY